MQDGVRFNTHVKEDGNFCLFHFGYQRHTCKWKKLKHPNFALLQKNQTQHKNSMHMLVDKTFRGKNMCAFPISSYRKETMDECVKHILRYQQMVARHELIHVIYRNGNHQGKKIVICLHLSSSKAQLNHVNKLSFFFVLFFHKPSHNSLIWKSDCDNTKNLFSTVGLLWKHLHKL